MRKHVCRGRRAQRPHGQAGGRSRAHPGARLFELVKRLLDGAMPDCPDIWFGIVDVRDVADLHIKAMTDPAARGERFLATAGDFLSVRQVAQILKDGAGGAGRKVPTRPLPSWLMRMVALFDPAVKGVVPELGKRKNGSNEKARRLLGWAPHLEAGGKRGSHGPESVGAWAAESGLDI
jgi:nucleoside-diphosphate-sugar epimerase